MTKLQSIPTNVITGFLGAGKTTAILHLLKQKPATERWAILVNEFGEVGIDGSLFSGNESEIDGVFVREVPGGCMCCTAGLPMQIALNMLLTRAKPDRLLIEPTGLGHPKEVLAVLANEHYCDVLDLQATVTLVDARKVHESRYTDHSTFNQQLDIADIIVANKRDQYEQGDFPALLAYLDTTLKHMDKPIYQVSNGALGLEWLNTRAAKRELDQHHHQNDLIFAPATPEIPAEGYLSVANEGEGFYSSGWIFSPEWIFDSRKLYTLLMGVNAERIKGVFITDQGIAGYNKADNVLTESALDDTLDSRIECISCNKDTLQSIEKALLGCITSR